MIAEMLRVSFQEKGFRIKDVTLYHTGLSQRRVSPLTCVTIGSNWKQSTFGGLFLLLIKTEIICKNPAGILKPTSCTQKDFFSSLKTSNSLCLLPPLTHIYQTLKATSGLYRKVCLLGDGTKNITFLSECNKNSLNKISKGRSHYSLPELEAPVAIQATQLISFKPKSLAKFAGLLGTLSKAPECLSSRHQLPQKPKQAK